ncbi:Thioredoxin-like domain-containing protein [Phanerochaete sordida]|uniref:Thioredoxin-like domain-containing protein n=1 Tax=Phanerochaete sordida TaxID=48140 RepID=A0A9P3G609_9APHY|nr:Thioredoxin-like domain-containing protein [Phanerochaete sordida]
MQLLVADADNGSDDALSTATETDDIVSLIQQYPVDADTDYTAALTPEELSELGLQAAQLIADSSDPLAALKQLSQDFPKYATTIARRVTVSDALEAELLFKNARVAAGGSAAWLNGAPLTEGNMNPFSLLRLLRKERAIMRQLAALGLSPAQSLDLLTHRAVGIAQADTGVLDALFDASDRREGGAATLWCNDLRTDARYARWSESLGSLKNAMMYPGQMPSIRLNLFNVVLVLDLAHPTGLGFMANAVVPLISRVFPFRFGLVPNVETEDGLKMARLVYWLFENVGRERTLSFINRIARLQLGGPLAPPTPDWLLLDSEFAALLTESDDLSASLEAIMNGEDEAIKAHIAAARKYASRLATDQASAPHGHVFVNGKHFELDDDILRSVQMAGAQMFQHIQEAVFSGALTDDDAENVENYFYDLPSTAARRNRYIYPSDKTGELRIVNLPELLASAKSPSGSNAYVYPPGDAQLSFTTVVIADLDSEDGRAFANEVLSSMSEGSSARVSFVHNPSDPARRTAPGSASVVLGHLISRGKLAKPTPSKVIGLLDNPPSAHVQDDEQVALSAESVLDDVLEATSLAALDDEPFPRASRFILRELKIAPGAQLVVVNGRVVGPITPRGIVAEDMEALYAFEQRKRVGPVVVDQATCASGGVERHEIPRAEQAGQDLVAARGPGECARRLAGRGGRARRGPPGVDPGGPAIPGTRP